MSSALTVVWIAGAEPHEPWLERLRQQAPSHRYLGPGQWDQTTRAEVALVGGPPSEPFVPPVGVRLIQSVWAGVDSLLPHVPKDLPVARMVDDEMANAMSRTAQAHVLAAHLHHDDYARAQRRGTWLPQPSRLPGARTVGVLGLGAFGLATATDLRGLGFAVRGWSANPKRIAGIATYAGESQLQRFLSKVEIAICLLPLTSATIGVINARTLDWLPEGAVLINLARGPHIVEQDLLDALRSGRLRHATLDVFDEEPLPAAHSFWSNERITITPHVAAPSLIDTGVGVVAENLSRIATGAIPLHLTDRDREY